MQKCFHKIVLLTVFLAPGLSSFSQNNFMSDIRLIQRNRVDSVSDKKTIRPFIYSKTSSPVVKYNPVNLAFGGLLFIYQNALSPQFSANCLYNPSCSEFSKQSIREYGLLKGVFLSADRLMRCNRIAATGIHPVRIINNKVIDPVEFYRVKR